MFAMYKAQRFKQPLLFIIILIAAWKPWLYFATVPKALIKFYRERLI